MSHDDDLTRRVLADAIARLDDPDLITAQAVDPKWQRIRRQVLDPYAETRDPMLRYAAGLPLRFWADASHRSIDESLDLLYILMVAWQVESDDPNPEQQP